MNVNDKVDQLVAKSKAWFADHKENIYYVSKNVLMIPLVSGFFAGFFGEMFVQLKKDKASGAPGKKLKYL